MSERKPLLVKDWKKVLKKSLAVWFAAASGAFGLVAENQTAIFSFLTQNQDVIRELLVTVKPHLSEHTFSRLATFFAFAAIFGRLKFQPSISEPNK